jgi:antitoxin-like ribbon-helix-helix protein
MPPDLFWDLKQLAVEKRTNVTELVNEALHDILVKYGKRKTKK